MRIRRLRTSKVIALRPRPWQCATAPSGNDSQGIGNDCDRLASHSAQGFDPYRGPHG